MLSYACYGVVQKSYIFYLFEDIFCSISANSQAIIGHLTADVVKCNLN